MLRYLLITALSLFLTATDYAQEKAQATPNTYVEKQKAIASAKETTREKYPDADSVLIDDYEMLSYKPDGTSVSFDEVYEKILTEKGKRNSRVLTFHYTLPYSTVSLPLLEIIRPDGKTVPVDVKANSKVMVDPSSMNQNIYNPNDKQLQVRIPELNIGDTIHYMSQRDTVKARVPDTWSNYFVLEYTNPIKNYHIVIDAPASLPLRNIQLKDEITGHVKSTVKKDEKAGRIRYEWHAFDIPRIFREPSMPPYYTVCQRLLVSTIPDWQSISKWYWNLSLPHLNATTPEMEKAVKALTAGLKTPQDKIKAIFQFVSQKIRYMGITTEKVAPGYEPHDVKITFENKYGVCRDKAALLVAMLRLAGFKAFPVLIHNGPKKDEEVPQPYFNHAIACVEDADGSYQLMDTTDETTTDLFPSYLCDQSFLVAKPEGEKLLTSPIVPARKNLVLIETKANVVQNGNLTAHTTLRFQGVNDGIYRGFFSRQKPEQVRQFFAGRLNAAVAGANLVDMKIRPANLRDMSKPLIVDLTYEAENALVSGSTASLFKPPWMGTSFGVVNFILGNTGLQKRKYPFVTEMACGVQETMSIQFRNAVGAAKSIPEYQTIDSKTMLWKQSLQAEHHTLNGTAEFLIKVVEFSPEQYLQLKQALRDIEYSRRKIPIFNCFCGSDDQPTKPDIEVLNETVFVKVHDEHSWDIDKTVRKKILSYAGKKSNSEIKIPYNPVWETVNITAKVTSADGKVKELAKEERNLMDASWVGSAPRYPAGKLLVCNLPAVELGSTVEYTIKRSIKNHPFFSIMGYFRYNNPLKAKNVTLQYPASLDGKLSIAETPGITFEKKPNGKVVTCTWSSPEQTAIRREDNMPPWWTLAPTLLASSGNWRDYSKQVYDVLDKASTPDDKVRNKTQEVVAKAKSMTEKVKAIRDFVAKTIRNAGPGLTSLPLSTVSPAAVTLTDGYGNDPDTAVLLAAMLKAVDLKPEFILASDTPNVPRVLGPMIRTPQVFFFSDVLVQVTVDGKTIYLNDTNQYAPLGATHCDGSMGLRLPTGEIAPIAVTENMRNQTDTTFHLALDAKGNAPTLQRSYTYLGTDCAYFRQRCEEMPPEEKRRYFLEAAAAISQSAVVRSTDSKSKVYPGVETLVTSVKRLAVREGNYMYFELPGNSLKRLFSIRSNTRSAPFWIGEPIRFNLNYVIDFPEGMSDTVMQPEDFREEIPGCGYVSLSSSKSPTGGVNMLWQVDIKPGIVSPRDYCELVRINAFLRNPKMNLILLSP